jgi:plastocyanin
VTSTSVPTGANSFDSGNLVQGATFRMTFTVPGTYQYKCSYHFWMQGTVVVVS